MYYLSAVGPFVAVQGDGPPTAGHHDGTGPATPSAPSRTRAALERALAEADRVRERLRRVIARRDETKGSSGAAALDASTSGDGAAAAGRDTYLQVADAARRREHMFLLTSGLAARRRTAIDEERLMQQSLSGGSARPASADSATILREHRRRIGLDRLEHCGLCDVQFPRSLLPTAVTYKTIREVQRRWRETYTATTDTSAHDTFETLYRATTESRAQQLSDAAFPPSVLYSRRYLCRFCGQFVGVHLGETHDEATTSTVRVPRPASASPLRARSMSPSFVRRERQERRYLRATYEGHEREAAALQEAQAREAARCVIAAQGVVLKPEALRPHTFSSSGAGPSRPLSSRSTSAASANHLRSSMRSSHSSASSGTALSAASQSGHRRPQQAVSAKDLGTGHRRASSVAQRPPSAIRRRSDSDPQHSRPAPRSSCTAAPPSNAPSVGGSPSHAPLIIPDVPMEMTIEITVPPPVPIGAGDIVVAAFVPRSAGDARVVCGDPDGDTEAVAPLVIHPHGRVKRHHRLPNEGAANSNDEAEAAPDMPSGPTGAFRLDASLAARAVAEGITSGDPLVFSDVNPPADHTAYYATALSPTRGGRAALAVVHRLANRRTGGGPQRRRW